MHRTLKLLSLATLTTLISTALTIALHPLLATSASAQTTLKTDRKAEADRLLQQGREQVLRGQIQEAIGAWEQALMLYRELGDRVGEGLTLSGLGLVYENLGQFQQAIEFYEQHLVISRELNSQIVEGLVLRNLGRAYLRLEQSHQAIEFYEQALKIFQDLGKQEEEGDVLTNLGIAYQNLGQYQRAIEFHEQALVIAQELGDRVGEGNALGNLGISHNNLGQYQQAIDFYEQGLAVARKLDDLVLEARALGNLGITYDNLGQYQRAIEFYEQSLAIARKLGDRFNELANLNNLGIIYDSLGQYQQAIVLFEQALTIAQEIENRGGEGQVLGSLGRVFNHLGQYQQAVVFHEQSLAIFRELDDRDGEGTALSNLGFVFNNLGQYQKAIKFLEQSLGIAREIGDLAMESSVLIDSGIAYNELGEYQQAIHLYEESLAIVREIGDRNREGITLNNLGSVLNDTSQFVEAEMALRGAIETFELLREGLPDAQRIAIADTQAQAYANLEIALIAQDKITEALEVTERGRAQAFALQLALRQRNTEADPVTSPSTAEIQRIAQQQNSTLVEYSLSVDRQTLNIWVIQPSGDIDFEQVSLANLSTDTLTAFIQQTRDALGVRGSRAGATPQLKPEAIARLQAATDQNLQALHALLIEPIVDVLPTEPEANVVFIPQGELFLVPFPALKDTTGTYLIEKHTIATAPSIQVLQLANEVGEADNFASLQAENALIVGNPTMPTVAIADYTGLQTIQLAALPGAQREAEAIGDFLNLTPLIGSQATEATVKQQLASANLIHLATYGLLEYGDPQASGVRDFPGAIALTPGNGEDGLLTASEILDMDLQASLAILSACDTGRGRITGDGVVGLSRSFMTVGVPSVIVSLWAVPDAPTADLMTEFYRRLDQGRTKAQALRQAMLTTMQDHPDPKDWAAFTLIGKSE